MPPARFTPTALSSAESCMAKKKKPRCFYVLLVLYFADISYNLVMTRHEIDAIYIYIHVYCAEFYYSAGRERSVFLEQLVNSVCPRARAKTPPETAQL